MRPRRTRTRTGVALLLPVTAVAVATSVLLGASAPAQVFHAQGSSTGAARAATTFGVRVGSATGLSPGATVGVPVRYTNPFTHALVVKSQRIEVTSPTSACAATHVDLAPARSALAKALVVPARGSRTLTVALTLRPTAPDGCQGVRFTTTVRAQGRKP